MSQTPPAFPYAASTILNTRPNTAKLKVSGWEDEKLSTDATGIYPGMICTLQSDDSLKRHGVYGGRTELLVAVEDAGQGHSLADVYASGDLVTHYIPRAGDEMLFLVNASCPAIVEGQQLISAGDGTVVVSTGLSGLNLYTNVADSAAVTNTVTETAFNKSYTIPANSLQVGDVIRIRGQALATATHSTDTLVVKVYIGATAICATATLDVADNDIASFDIVLTVRTIGASGTFVAAGTTTIGPPTSATTKAFNLLSTALDTTVTEAITVKATWSVADVGNSVLLKELVIDLDRGLTPLVVAKEAVDNSANAATMAYITCRVL